MKLVIAEPLSVSEGFLASLTAPLHRNGWDIEIHTTRPADQSELGHRLSSADAAVIANFPCTRNALSQAAHLKYLCIAFTGVDHADIAYCRSHHIAVSNCAGYSTEAVAELVFALVLSLSRKIFLSTPEICSKKSAPPLLGTEIAGKQFGIIGTGRIGQRVASLAQAFGCTVWGWSRTQNDSSIHYTNLETLLQTSDILSIHLPLTEETRHLIGADELALMKPTSLLINTARGPIIDYEALSAALKEHRIGGAGIDVFEQEPPLPETHPLMDMPNCILTPHIGFFSAEAMEKRARIVFDNLESWANGYQKNTIC